jgi:signal transduction histidine kinase
MRLIGENIELVAELADDLGFVRMDPAQLQQVVLNLVLNARDAMPDGGRITLHTNNCDGPRLGRDAHNQFCDSWVVLAVSDTGCGMDAETRARVFEPFFTTKKPGQGNGLGLATVYRIVTHEGGTIEVESETGRGTRVVLYLPRVGVEAKPFNLPEVANRITPPPTEKTRRARKGKIKRGKSL